jgi:cytochrome c553
MKRKLVLVAVVVSVIGTLGLFAALHHVVVLTARGTAFSNSFAGTCSACHGIKYANFGTTEPD